MDKYVRKVLGEIRGLCRKYFGSIILCKRFLGEKDMNFGFIMGFEFE
jgi:hypothetical protein